MIFHILFYQTILNTFKYSGLYFLTLGCMFGLGWNCGYHEAGTYIGGWNIDRKKDSSNTTSWDPSWYVISNSTNPAVLICVLQGQRKSRCLWLAIPKHSSWLLSTAIAQVSYRHPDLYHCQQYPFQTSLFAQWVPGVLHVRLTFACRCELQQNTPPSVYAILGSPKKTWLVVFQHQSRVISPPCRCPEVCAWKSPWRSTHRLDESKPWRCGMNSGETAPKSSTSTFLKGTLWQTIGIHWIECVVEVITQCSETDLIISIWFVTADILSYPQTHHYCTLPTSRSIDWLRS